MKKLRLSGIQSKDFSTERGMQDAKNKLFGDSLHGHPGNACYISDWTG